VNNISVVHDNIKLIFSTLWSKISPVNQWEIQSRLSDFRVIENRTNILSVRYYNYLHKESIAFIESELEQNQEENTVVVTHHVPTLKNYPERFKQSSINEAFAVELFDLIEKSDIDYWIYGHHHENIPEFEIENTKFVTNQLGYVKYKENENSVNGSFFELGD
jgi:DNA repair exonuclease SbcCD nuclease subunit